MSEWQCDDPWYQELEKKYGYDYCVLAGYFKELNPFNFKYSDKFKLPKNDIVIQFSGAFYPFHDGHFTIVSEAINHYVKADRYSQNISVVIHVDHIDYCQMKGSYPKEERDNAIKAYVNKLKRKHKKVKFYIVDENKVENNCSRNFTRLYSELNSSNEHVYFLCGGDRANFILSFMDDGDYLVIGRSDHPKFKLYNRLSGYDSYWPRFLEIDHPASSTEIRNNYNKTV